MALLLSELEPEFLRWIDDHHFERCDSIGEADGILFVCPKCFINNGRQRPGVHSIICWEPNVPQTTKPAPGRWNLVGTGIHDLSLVAGVVRAADRRLRLARLGHQRRDRKPDRVGSLT